MKESITTFSTWKTIKPTFKFDNIADLNKKVSELLKDGYKRNTSIEKGKGYFEVSEIWLTITI